MIDYNKHIIHSNKLVKEALEKINSLANKNYQTLFVVDENSILVGSLTDGDVRRGLLKGYTVDDFVTNIMCLEFRYLLEGNINEESIAQFEKEQILLVPVINSDGHIVKIIDLSNERSFLPIDAIIMAGGRGMRLRPLTEKLPKPLLEVGGVPIIERNVNRLQSYGVENISITVNYLGEVLQDHFKETKLKIVEEKSFMGTIGSVTLIKQFLNEEILVMNSDLLTNIDYQDFYVYFKSTKSDMLIASIPYEVSVPYAVLETEEDKVISLKEKPKYTYYSNAGIYLIKRSMLDLIPKNQKYDATDLIETLIEKGKNVVSYPLRAYWLDIGNHRDYAKAQEDVKHIQF